MRTAGGTCPNPEMMILDKLTLMDPASEPEEGSVRANAAICSPTIKIIYKDIVHDFIKAW